MTITYFWPYWHLTLDLTTKRSFFGPENISFRFLLKSRPNVPNFIEISPACRFSLPGGHVLYGNNLRRVQQMRSTVSFQTWKNCWNYWLRKIQCSWRPTLKKRVFPGENLWWNMEYRCPTFEVWPTKRCRTPTAFVPYFVVQSGVHLMFTFASGFCSVSVL